MSKLTHPISMFESDQAAMNRYCVEFTRERHGQACESQCVFAYTEADAVARLTAEFAEQDAVVFVCDVYEG